MTTPLTQDDIAILEDDSDFYIKSKRLNIRVDGEEYWYKEAEQLKQQILQALQLEKSVRERIIKLQELYKLNCHTATLGLIEELQQLLGDKT